MSKSTFQAPAILTRIAYMKDGGLSLGFATNELSDEDKVTASKFHQKFGYVLFKENQFTEEDVPAADAEHEGKSPSQRLRSVLFIYWKQNKKGGDFDMFYRKEMEKFINHVKEAID